MNTEDYRLQMYACLLQDRPAFVWSIELGLTVPFAYGSADCLPLFDPWHTSFRAGYHSGSVTWCLPLSVLLSRIPREAVLVAVSKADPGLMRGCIWPYPALKLVAAGRHDDAERLLKNTFSQIDANALDLLNAAACHFYLLGNAPAAHATLEKSAERMSDSGRSAPSWTGLARAWMEMFGARDLANKALEEQIRLLSQDDEDYPAMEFDLACSLYFSMSDAVGAMEFVPNAKRLLDSSCTWSAVDAAFLWRTLFDDEREAAACVEVARAKPGNCSGSWPALIWNCAFLDDKMARWSLGQAETEGTGSSTFLDAAEGWMLHFGERKAAAVLLERAGNSADTGVPDMRIAPYWRTLLNDDARSDAFIGSWMSGIRALMPWLELAMTGARYGIPGPAAIGKLIDMAEFAAVIPHEFLNCGIARWRFQGDYVAFKRCMRMAAEAARDADELWTVFENERKVGCCGGRL